MVARTVYIDAETDKFIQKHQQEEQLKSYSAAFVSLMREAKVALHAKVITYDVRRITRP